MTRGAATLAVAALILFPLPVAPRIPRRAVIYLQPGSVSPDRQLRHCHDYCRRHGYDVHSIVPPTGLADAVKTASAEADLVVTAFAPRPRPGDLRDVAAEAGVPVEYVRPPVLRRELAETAVTVWRNTGRNVEEAARLLGTTTRNIRAALERLGLHPNGRSGKDRNDGPPDSRE